MVGDGLKWIFITIVVLAMIVLCIALWNAGGYGGLIGAGAGFLLRLGGKGLDAGERLGNAFAGAVMGLPLGLMAGGLYVFAWPAMQSAYLQQG